LSKTPLNILIVEDNLAHLKLTQLVLQRSHVDAALYVVRDGQEALDFLFNAGAFADPIQHPRPNLILLDLNIPKRDGREVLKLLKEQTNLATIPIVIVSTSDREEDVNYAFKNGAVAYVSKSAGFTNFSSQLTDVIRFAN
jgi:two-component system response regulator